MGEEKKMENNQTEDDNKGDPSTTPIFPPQRILASVDGSENATRALDVAIEISKKFGAKLFIMTVTPRNNLDLSVDLPGHMSAVQNYNDEMDKRSERILDDSFDLAKNKGCTNVETEAIPEFQSVTKQILEFSLSKKIDLIVLGTRGLGGFKKLLLGSVSSAVVTHTDCNVLVVR
jgi:nucleotide-binding universal stress UspA family protein